MLVNHGNSVISKYGLEDLVSYELPGGIEKRILGKCRLSISGTEVNFFVAHLSLSKMARIRKISAFLQSKKLNFTLISCKTKEGIEELKEKIFRSFNKIRIFTKEPGKEKSERPFILAGDFNTSDKSEIESFAKSLGNGVQYQSHDTYPTWRPNKPLDYIFLSKDFELVRSYTSKEKLSDHLPLIYEVKLK